MSFYDLPDRQVVYTLAYLRDALRADKYARQWLKTSDAVVDHTIARFFHRSTIYKGEPAFQILASGLPYLALYRDKLHTECKGVYRTRAVMGLGWVARMPGPSADFDAIAWGNTLASNMWHVTREKLLLMSEDDEAIEKAGIDDIEIGSCDLLEINAEGLCGYEASITITHTVPPYDIEDLDDYNKTILEIKLYDSASLGPDGVQGLDLGLSVGSEIDAN